MIHTIKNEFLTVSAKEAGAELMSILGADGTEYLWQGDPKYWSDRALNIFPYVARLNGGKYYLDGELHEMAIHGIAPYRDFTVTENDGTRMVFALRSDEKTYDEYPRNFVFQIVYALQGKTLTVSFRCENLDGKTMYFGLGGHPGFNVPLAPGKKFEDYRLRFAENCEPYRVGFNADCFVTHEDVPFALEDGKYGKGIINNAKTKIVLNLEDEEAQRVQSTLRLSDAEIMERYPFGSYFSGNDWLKETYDVNQESDLMNEVNDEFYE